MLGQRLFQPYRPAAGSPTREDCVAGLPPSSEQFAAALMVNQERSQVFEPNLSHMGGKAYGNDATKWIDRLAPFRLPDPKQGRPRCVGGLNRDGALTSLHGLGEDSCKFGLIRDEPRIPAIMQLVQPDFHLCATRLIEALPTRRLPGKAMLSGMSVDLLGTLRHLFDQCLWDAPDFEQSLARIEVDLKSIFPQMVGKGVTVDLAAGHLLGIHGPRFETGHRIARIAVRHVEDHDMGMQMGVEFAAGMLSKACPQEPPRRLMNDFPFFPAAQLGMFFKIGKRCVDSLLMRRDHPLIAKGKRHDRYGFGGADRKIPSGMVVDPVCTPTP